MVVKKINTELKLHADPKSALLQWPVLFLVSFGGFCGEKSDTQVSFKMGSNIGQHIEEEFIALNVTCWRNQAGVGLKKK